MIHTKFNHMTNEELIRLVTTSDCTQLEIELAQRLSEAEDEIEDLSSKELPPLSKSK
jgi:hypothetical protein